MIEVGDYQYQEKDILGEGGFGAVFQGRDKRNLQPVAVKRARICRLCNPSTLKKEMNMMKGFSHDNVVKILGFHENSKGIHLILEFCNGGDLRKHLREKGNKMNTSELQHFMRQMVAGLSALEKQKIIHRDIKPENILLKKTEVEEEGKKKTEVTFKLADFGLSRYLKEGDVAQSVVGTPSYMAPELRAEAQRYDRKVDVWSLGIVLLECWKGQRLMLQDITDKFQNGLFALVKDVRSHDTDESNQCQCLHLLIGMLKEDPRDRFRISQLEEHPFITGKEEPIPDFLPKADLCDAALASLREKQVERAGSAAGLNTWLILGGIALIGGLVAYVMLAKGGTDNTGGAASARNDAQGPSEKKRRAQ